MKFEQLTLSLLLFLLLSCFTLLALSASLRRDIVTYSVVGFAVGSCGLVATFDFYQIPLWAMVACNIIPFFTLFLLLRATRKQLANNFLISGVLHKLFITPFTLIRRIQHRK